MLSPKQTISQLFEKMIALLFLGVSKILHPESSPSHDSLAVVPASSSHTRSYTKLTSHEVHYRYPPCPRWGCCDWKCCCCQCQGRGSPLPVIWEIWEASCGCRIGCMPGASSPQVNSRGAPLQTTPTWNNRDNGNGNTVKVMENAAGKRDRENVVALVRESVWHTETYTHTTHTTHTAMISRRAYMPPPKRPKRTIISDVEPVWHIVVVVGFVVRILLGTFGTPLLGRSGTVVSRYRMR